MMMITLTDYFNRAIEKRKREYNHRSYAPGIFKGDRGGGSVYAYQIRTWYVGKHAGLYDIADGISLPELFNNWAPISSRSEWDRLIDELIRYSGTRERRQGGQEE